MAARTDAPQGELGLVAALALVLGTMIGSGVFMLPVALAPYGWSALGGWAISIAGALALAGCYALLSRRLTGICGAQTYVTAAFGPVGGFFAVWSYWIGAAVGLAAISVSFTSNLSVVMPALASDAGLGVWASLGVLALVTLINLAGVRSASVAQQLTTLIKLLPMLAVLAIAAWLLAGKGGAAVVTPPAAMTGSAVFATVTLTMWGMLGFESAAMPAGRIRRPEVNVPLATMLATLLAGLLYMAISAAMIAFLPRDVLLASHAPVADFVRPFLGGNVAALLGVFVAVAALGALNGLTMVAAELPRALAAAGQVPALFARLNRAGAPVASLLLAAVLAGALVLANSSRSLSGLFQFAILISTSALLICHLAVALAAVKLLAGPARLLGLAGTAYALFALNAAGLEASGWCLALVAAGVPVLLLSRRRG